jgi:spore maturation protein CgeB
MNLLLLYASNQSDNLIGRHIDPKYLRCAYDFRNWIDGFSSLGHQLSVFDYYKYTTNFGPIKTEDEIKKLVDKKNVDLVILPSYNFEIGVSFLSYLRNKKVKILIVFFDDFLRFEDTNLYYIGLCDYIVTHESKFSSKLYEKFNCNISFFPNYPSLKFYKKLLFSKKNTKLILPQVSFVGSNILDRSEYILRLNKEGLKISVFGHGWPNGKLTQEDMLCIFNGSEISLNFTKSIAGKNLKQLKGRAFEIILAGGFLLTENDDELLDYFEPGKDIDTFSNYEECKKKIIFYLDNPDQRKAMQKHAFQKCISVYNFENSWSNYLNKIENCKNTYKFIIPYKNYPNLALKNFVYYNLHLFVARVKNKNIKLAIDQILFCIKDISFFSDTYSKKVWLIFFQTVFFLSLAKIRFFLSKIKLFKDLKKSIS